jgi:hypothetical protein
MCFCAALCVVMKLSLSLMTLMRMVMPMDGACPAPLLLLLGQAATVAATAAQETDLS